MIPPITTRPPSAATTADMPNLVALEGGCSAVDATGTGRGVLDFGVEDGGAELDGGAAGAACAWTGGTGFGPRDVTPEATASVLEREAPGLVHVMLARGLESTPMAALTRARAGTVGSALVINLPGSPRGAIENLAAVIDVLPHALSLLAGDTEHHSGHADSQG